jgi:PAS domain S-box-containing protein
VNGERCVLATVTDVSALENTRQELQRVNRALRTLSDCSQIVATAHDEETLLRQHCQAIVSSGGYLFAWVGYAGQDPGQTVTTRATAGGNNEFARDWQVSWGDNEYGGGPAGIAIRTARPVACTDLLHDSRLAPWWDRIRGTQARSMVALPVRVGDEVIGALTICTSELNSFGAEEVKLLVRLADDLGFGIRALRERARKEAAEVDVRRLLQEAEQSRAILLSILEDQIRSEAALRISEERFRSALEHSPIGMALVGLDGRWLMVNEALCTLVGYPRERILESGFRDFTHPDELGFVDERMQALLHGAIESYELEKRYVHASGQTVWVRVNMSLIRNPDGTPRHFIKQIQDITERRHAEQSLLELNRRYARHEAALSTLSRSYALAPEDLGKVLREIVEVVAWTLDVERVSVWTYVRSRNGLLCLELFERTSGRHSEGQELERRGHESYFAAMEASEVIAVSAVGSDPRTVDVAATALAPAGVGALLNTPIRSREGKSGALCCEHLGESRAWTSDEQTFAIAVANLLSLIFAQIEEQKLQAQLRHTQKLEALGTLAGGIAHDFNNILGAIISFTELARMDHPADAELQENLGEVIKACNRATGLVRQILAFSRRQDPVRVPISLTPVVQEALKLIRSTLPAGIEIESRIEDQLPSVLADANQIHQVIVNLCANAEHAMRGQSGLLKVSLGMKPDTTPADRMVQITISDTGHGMSDAVMRRIFDPFFTTKGPGEGTGLGLAVVHGIVEEHKGTIDVESKVGAGSTFRIALPVCDATDARQTAEPARRLAGSGQRILFVDDETALLTSASQLLEYQGFRVESYGDPEAALELIRREPHRFDAVITDLAMPRVNGMDVARQILQIAPHLPVLIMTGYAGELTPDVVKSVGIDDLILKPIDFPTLAAKLAAACARSAAARGEGAAPPAGT